MSNLVNIYNRYNEIYLFEREGRNLNITRDNSFLAFYYERDENGKYMSYDGHRLRKVEVRNPFDIKKHCSKLSYSSDIKHVKNYIVRKIDKFEKVDYKYFFIDIEILAVTEPNVYKADQPITSITVYNNHSNEIKTFWILDYDGNTLLKQEKMMMDDFLTYFTNETPDILLAWNVDFDYTYLHNRYFTIFGENSFAKVLSPVKFDRFGSREYNTRYPAGISIMDYLTMFKKVLNREPSYTLDAVSQKYLNDDAWGTSNFGEITPDIKEKNYNDVLRMKKLEQKFKLMAYFDETRRLTKTEWEDLPHNSLVIEHLLLQEAYEKNVVLPNKPDKSEVDEDETFQGAARDALKTGALFDIGKFDLTSAYPTAIVEFCLDSSNIVDDGSGVLINNVEFQQDHYALLPSMVRKILQLKDDLKKQLKNCQVGTDEYADLEIKYDAIKRLVNSGFGVVGFSSFRLYDNRVANSITYLIRDLLQYTRERVAELGYEVIYYDTDSTFLTTKDNVSDKLNQFIQDWAKKYGKSKVNLFFEYEGYFKNIFIVTICRYIGELVTKRGIKPEIKGIEAKRSNSTKFEGDFQLELIKRMLNKESKESIIKWINEEKDKIKLVDLELISFPCKKSSKKYATLANGKELVPIFVRAYKNTCQLKKLDVPVGEVMWWAYVIPKYLDKLNNPIDVLAFSKYDKEIINKHEINWDLMIKRNIINKAEAIFNAQGWNISDLNNINQITFW